MATVLKHGGGRAIADTRNEVALVNETAIIHGQLFECPTNDRTHDDEVARHIGVVRTCMRLAKPPQR